MISNEVRKEPCQTCPYRRDVPSGVWSASEYDLLPLYDAPTQHQPPQGFSCHATPEFYCHGWAVVHSNRGSEFELLALRIEIMMRGLPFPSIPEPFVPLFASGADAAAHGKAEIEAPSDEAKAVIAKLTRKYPRLQYD